MQDPVLPASGRCPQTQAWARCRASRNAGYPTRCWWRTPGSATRRLPRTATAGRRDGMFAADDDPHPGRPVGQVEQVVGRRRPRPTPGLWRSPYGYVRSPRTRPSTHFLRNLLARVPKGNAEMVAAAIRTIFAQPDDQHVHAQLDVIAGMLGKQFPVVESMLQEAAEDVLAFTSSRSGTGRRSGPPTRSSGSTRRASNAVPTSSASSPTPKHCSDWPARSWSRPTTNGPSPTAATSPRTP